VKEKGGNPFSGDGFFGRAQNHPLSKAMVDHDQKRIEAVRKREVSDKVTGQLLEGTRGRGLNRGERGTVG
jgi:hypothetical protein